MNAIQVCLNMLRFKIPERILQEAFLERSRQWRVTGLNIDEAIRNQVIRPRVLVDCNLHGGTHHWVGLEDVPYERTDDYTSVYRIPKSKTQNRSIIAVLNVTFTDALRANAFGVTGGCDASTEMQAAQAAMDAHANIPQTSTARVQLIAENTVMVRDSMVLPPNVYLRCILANDENMSHLQLRSFPDFVQLCEYAVKSYIYNKLIIDIDIGQIQAGQQIGKIKEIVESYADQEQLYTEYLLTRFAKVLFQNDDENMHRLQKLIIGGYR